MMQAITRDGIRRGAGARAARPVREHGRHMRGGGVRRWARAIPHPGTVRKAGGSAAHRASGTRRRATSVAIERPRLRPPSSASWPPPTGGVDPVAERHGIGPRPMSAANPSPGSTAGDRQHVRTCMACHVGAAPGSPVRTATSRSMWTPMFSNGSGQLEAPAPRRCRRALIAASGRGRGPAPRSRPRGPSVHAHRARQLVDAAPQCLPGVSSKRTRLPIRTSLRLPNGFPALIVARPAARPMSRRCRGVIGGRPAGFMPRAGPRL